MESNRSEKRNDVLSQSYIQGVERVAQQDNVDAGFSFDLPKEVLEDREKAWGHFFEKYADDASNEIELNINTMEPVIDDENDDDEEDEDDDDNDDDNNDDDDNDDEEDDKDENKDKKESHRKGHHSMRRQSALIQYWVDTGKSPYQGTYNGHRSETGSSLSEGKHSRSGRSAVIPEFNEKPKFDENSPYSSVDTAAYILSNANVTKKSEAMAIVEGAKGANGTFVSVVSPSDSIPGDEKTGMEKRDVASIDQGPKSIVEALKSPTLPITATPLKNLSFHESSILPKCEEKLNVSFTSKNGDEKISQVSANFLQLDEKDSKRAETPKIGSTLSHVADFMKNDTQDTTKMGRSRFFNRRKLYTGRNSPVDLIMAKMSTENSGSQPGQSSHPALDIDESVTRRRMNFGILARGKRKKKRTSRQYAARMSGYYREVDCDSSLDSNELTKKLQDNDNKEGRRYTDFFESLGLTPSKTYVGKNSAERRSKKRMRKSVVQARSAERNVRNDAKNCESTESSVKESQDTSQTSNDLQTEKITVDVLDWKNIVNSMIPHVSIVKLSEDTLAKYQKREMIVGTSSPRKIKGNEDEFPHLEANIELLTTNTQDSDSSTILICSCNKANNPQYSDSECSLITKNLKRQRTCESSRNEESLRKENMMSIDEETRRETRSSSRISAVARNIDTRVEKSLVAKQSIRDSSRETSRNEEISKRESIEKIDEETTRATRSSSRLFAATRNIDDCTENPLVDEKSNRDISKPQFSRILVVKLDRMASPEVAGLMRKKLRRKILDSNRKSRNSSAVYPPQIVEKTDTQCVTIGSQISGESDKSTDMPKKIDGNSRARLPYSLGIPEFSLNEEENNFVKLLQDLGSNEKGGIGVESKKARHGRHNRHRRKEKIPSLLDSANEEILNFEKSNRPITRSLNKLVIALSSDEENEDIAKFSRDSTGRGRKISESVSTRSQGHLTEKRMIEELIEDLTQGDENMEIRKNINDEFNKDLEEKIDTENKEFVDNDVKTHKERNADSEEPNGLRRSPRKKLSVFHKGETESAEKREKENHRRKLNFHCQETVDDESPKVKLSQITWESDESKNQKIKSAGESVMILRKSERTSRFKTQLNSDSDSEIPSVEFTAMNGVAEINETEKNSISPVGSLRSKIDKKNRLNMGEIANGNFASENDDLISPERSPLRTKTEKIVEKKDRLVRGEIPNGIFSSKNGLVNIDESAKNKVSDSYKLRSSKRKNIEKSEIKFNGQDSRRNLTLDDRQKNSKRSTKEVNVINQETNDEGESRQSRKKKSRRTKILGTPMDYESDEDVAFVEVVSNDEKSKSQNERPNNCSKNLFSHLIVKDDEVDSLFGVDGSSRVTRRSAGILKNLNLATTRKELTNARESTIKFRTRLSVDTDDDDEL